MSKPRTHREVEGYDTSSQLRTHRDVENYDTGSSAGNGQGDLTDEEWKQIKSKGTPSDADYERRYQSLLKRYNIKRSDSGAMEMQSDADPKDEPQSKPASEMTHRQVEDKSMEGMKMTGKSSQGQASKPAIKSKSRSVTTARKGTSSENRYNNTIGKRPIKGKESTEAHTPKEKYKTLTVPKMDKHESKLSVPKHVNLLVQARNEYQSGLIEQHKKEMAKYNQSRSPIIGGRASGKVHTVKDVYSKPTAKKRTNAVVEARNSYQQELMKKRKKEMESL